MSKLLSLGDVNTALSLTAMAVLDKLCPSSRLDSALEQCARIHLALRGSKAGEIDSVVRATDIGSDADQIEREFLTGVYREMLYTLREYDRGGWDPQIQLRGRQHVEDALRIGRGAVLWTFPCTYGGLVGKKALYAAGFEVAMVANHVHPYSGTRLGRRLLNPVRTRIEDRYIVERVTLYPGAEAVAMRRVIQLLAENKLVEIAAVGVSDSPKGFSFLGGTLNLALGAPTVATMAGSALIPCFPIPSGSGGFEVFLEPPLSAGDAAGPRDVPIQLARGYKTALRKYVLKAPQVWRGWFNRTNWTPPAAEDVRMSNTGSV